MAYFSLLIDSAAITESYLRRHWRPDHDRYIEAVLQNGNGSNLPGFVGPSERHGLGLFASRDIVQGETFRLTVADLVKMSRINDGAYFPECSAYSLFEMRIFYDDIMGLYKQMTSATCNIAIASITNPLFAGRVIATKTIKKGEEFLRSYGIPAWIVNTNSRLDNNAVYRLWVSEQFASIFGMSSRLERFEAMSVIAVHKTFVNV